VNVLAAAVWLLDRCRCKRSTRIDARDEPAATAERWEPGAQSHLEWTWDEQPQPIPSLPADHVPEWARETVPPMPTRLELALTAGDPFIRAEFKRIVQAQVNARGEWRARTATHPSSPPDAGLPARTGQPGPPTIPRKEKQMGAKSSSFTLRDNQPEELRRAGIWAAATVLDHPELDPHTALAEILRAIGLLHDPDGRDRRALSKITTRRGDEQC